MVGMHMFFFDVFVVSGRMGTLKSQKDRRREAAKGMENTFHNVNPLFQFWKIVFFWRPDFTACCPATSIFSIKNSYLFYIKKNPSESYSTKSNMLECYKIQHHRKSSAGC